MGNHRAPRRLALRVWTTPVHHDIHVSLQTNSPPLPFLFQWRHGLVNAMITQSHAGTLMARIVAASAITHNDGTPARFTPHDFRRIFATAAVAAGLPVHIAAKVLGHDNLNTTQGYVAVYDHDVIEHHRAFIARRRQQRPSAEYRDVTDAEWDGFLAHFEKRKVELGTCGRAYATPCVHEHACIRCPLLRPDPKQLERRWALPVRSQFTDEGKHNRVVDRAERDQSGFQTDRTPSLAVVVENRLARPHRRDRIADHAVPVHPPELLAGVQLRAPTDEGLLDGSLDLRLAWCARCRRHGTHGRR